MQRLKLVLAAIAVTVGCSLVGTQRSSATETPTGQWKWVDSDDNCVSECDKSQFKCPCYRL